MNVFKRWSDRNAPKQSLSPSTTAIQVEVKVNITIEKSEDIIPFVIKFGELSPELVDEPRRIV